MKFFQLLTILFLGLVAPNAYALDLVESYHLAAENSSELAAARVSSQAEGLSHDIAISELYPTLTFGASARKSNPFRGDDSRISQGRLVITQPLWRESLISGLKTAALQADLAELNYKKEQLSLFVKVVNAYFGALSAQDTLNTAESEIASIRTLRDHAVVRRDAGLGTETDVRIAEARLALARAAVIMAHNSVETAMLQLSELIGHRPAELSVLNDATSAPELQPGQMEFWIDLALTNNIDLAIQQMTVSIASGTIDLVNQQSDFRADLTARVNDKFDGTESIRDHTFAELTLSKSFSAGGLGTKRKQQATLRYEAQLQILQGLKARTVTRASSTFRNVVSLIDQVAALELAVAANESALELTESNYDVGLVTSLAVLDAQQDVFEVRRDLHKARYEYFQSLVALKEVAGTLDLADLEALNEFLL